MIDGSVIRRSDFGHLGHSNDIFVQISAFIVWNIGTERSNMHGQKTERLKSEQNLSDFGFILVWTKIANEL